MKIKYRPEIDGLRALAVIAVILFHAEFLISFNLGNKSFNDIRLFEGGFLGVDIFFVISGYLITSLILKGLNENIFSIKDFYERRARRILPILFFIILVSIPLSFTFLLPKQIEENSLSALATLFFGSNIWFWLVDGYSYWSPINEFKPLLHTWSLAVEEQFYIFYPIFLIIIFKKFNKHLFSILFIIFLISLQIAQFGSSNYVVANFYLLPSRGWELISGALLAKLQYFSFNKNKITSLNYSMPLIGLFLIINSMIFFDGSTKHPSMITTIPIIGTMLIIWYSKRGELVYELLSSKFLVSVGKISYSLYLWHYLLFSYTNSYFQRTESIWTEISYSYYIKLLLIFLSVLLSIITYNYIEKPFRSKKKISTKLFINIILISFILLITFFGYSYSIRGFTDSYAKKNPFYLAYVPIEENTPPKMLNDNECKFHSKVFNESLKKKIISCKKKYGPGLFIIGDSHAMNIYNLMFSHSNAKFIIGLSTGGCRAHNQGNCYYKKFYEFIKNESIKKNYNKSSNLSKIIYVQSGSYLFKKGDNLKHRDLFKKDVVEIYDLEYEKIGKIQKYLGLFNQFAEITWLGPRIEPSVDPKSFLITGCENNYIIKENIKLNFKILDKNISLLSKGNEYKYVSQIKAINFRDNKDLYNCDKIFWRDGDHFSEAGIDHFAPRIKKALKIQ